MTDTSPAIRTADDGQVTFRGLPLECTTVFMKPRALEIHGLHDAADLLDQPEFARRFEVQDRAPYGAQLWPSAVLLCERLTTLGPGEQRQALELGCGLGLLSIAAAGMGWHICATDADDAALELARFNAARNNITLPECRTLDWTQPPTDVQYPWIFAADVLYEKPHHQQILNCLNAVLEPGGTAVLTDPNRSVADPFLELAQAAGYDVHFECKNTEALERPHFGRVITLKR